MEKITKKVSETETQLTTNNARLQDQSSGEGPVAERRLSSWVGDVDKSPVYLWVRSPGFSSTDVKSPLAGCKAQLSVAGCKAQ